MNIKNNHNSIRHGVFIRTICVIVLYSLLCACTTNREITAGRELPDDYLPFVLRRCPGGYTGQSEYLKGFTISIDTHPGDSAKGLNIDGLFALARTGDARGVLTYPDGKTTPIAYEIVRHRGRDEIYMKTSLGYFLWEYLSVGADSIHFAVYWWYCPPATDADRRVLEMAMDLLADADHWHQQDDRKCLDDDETTVRSLYCALKHASLAVCGEYNHHNTAVQTVRFVIDDVLPDHEFTHTIMDFNNAPQTGHRDVLEVLAIARKRISKELDKAAGPGR